MRRSNRIVLSRADVERLRAILGTRAGSERDRAHLLDLHNEIEQARVVAERDMPANVVTLGSQARVRDLATGVLSDYTVVSPTQADASAGHISVLAPLGTALLGYREGDEVEWQMPGGIRRLEIDRVRQPVRDTQRSNGVTSVESTHVFA